MYCIEFRESTSVKNCQQKLHVTLCNELIIYRKSGILFLFAHDIPKKKKRKIVITCFFFWLKREGEIPPPPGYRFCITQETPISIPSRSLARSLKRNCKNVKNEPPRLSLSLSLSAYIAVNCLFLLSSAKTSLLIANTLSNPSRPFFAFSLNLSTLISSIALLIFCHPPHSATILASCSNTVLA